MKLITESKLHEVHYIVCSRFQFYSQIVGELTPVLRIRSNFFRIRGSVFENYDPDPTQICLLYDESMKIMAFSYLILTSNGTLNYR